MARDPAGWTLTFDDEFNSFGASGPWMTHYPWGARTLASNGELQYYSDRSVGTDPFHIEDGVLYITAAPSVGRSGGLPYTSGMINTSASFLQTYGFFEIRAQIPAAQGLWPTIWLHARHTIWPPEIDIFEGDGSKPNTGTMAIYSGSSTAPQVRKAHPYTPGVTSGFHIYGLDWEPDKITWYFDGREIWSTSTPADMHQPMYLIIDLAAGGKFIQSPIPAQLPASLKIDYVRIWSRKDGWQKSDSSKTVIPNDGTTNIDGTFLRNDDVLYWLPLILIVAASFLLRRRPHRLLGSSARRASL